MTRDPWTGLPLDPPETYTTYYARCRVCEEMFEEDDMAEIDDGPWMKDDVPDGRCRWCPKPVEEGDEV